MKNAFGKELYQIKDILKDATIKQTVSALLLPVLTYLEISPKNSKEIIGNCLNEASNYSSLQDYESQAHCILEREQVAQKIPQKLWARANLIFTQIEPYLVAGNMLDYGCGDGQVAELAAKSMGKEVVLADVYEHSHIKETGLKFTLFSQGTQVPFGKEEFDNTLAITVFHHSSNPENSIRDVCRVTKTGGRVVVIESVYDVNNTDLPDASEQKTQIYLSLSSEQQRKINIFFDHFYNRVLHYSKNPETKVNVPFNFNTPKNWETIFTNCGLVQEKIVHLGLDQPTVPEYHTMHILRKT
jgi:ubiquinone/menaquinone biosynthesis C-methylase UbiE